MYVEMSEAKSRGSGTYVRGSGNLYERATVLGSNTGGKAGLIKIKHASHYFATVSSNKIVLIRNLQVTRGYENKLIVALI